MNAFGKPYDLPYDDWDQEKVGPGFYRLLAEHPVFNREKKAISAAHSWLNEIAAGQHANEGRNVTVGYKTIQDHFRKFSQSHAAFIRALSQYRLVDISKVERRTRSFALTEAGWRLLQEGNYRWLHLLLTDPKTRRRNQVAIARRKLRRTTYADPTRRAIEEFRHNVTFDRAGLLKQLRVDNSRVGRTADMRRNFVIHPLLAFATRKFCELKERRGAIYHEWFSLPWHFRRFASFKGRQYIMPLECPKEQLCQFCPALCAYGESLGLALVYDYESVSVFGDMNDSKLLNKLRRVKAFIRHQTCETSAQAKNHDCLENPGELPGS